MHIAYAELKTFCTLCLGIGSTVWIKLKAGYLETLTLAIDGLLVLMAGFLRRSLFIVLLIATILLVVCFA